MAKQSLVTLPFVLLLLDYWPLRRFPAGLDGPPMLSRGHGTACAGGEANCVGTELGRFKFPWRLLVEKVPLFLLTAAFTMVGMWATSGVMAPFDRLPLWCRIGNTPVSYVAYLGALCYPLGLAAFYPHPGVDLPTWKIVAAAVVLASISAAALAGWRRRPYLIVGWLWYLGMLVPVIGLTQMGQQAMADRFTYLPQIGLCFALIWAAADLCQSRPFRRWACGVVSALVLAVLMGCAWRQTSFWCDSETLWTHALACTSRNGLAHGNLGTALGDLGRCDEAAAQFRMALEIQPNDVLAHQNLGQALTRLGRLDEALVQYRKAHDISPGFAEGNRDFGEALSRLGRFEETLAPFQKALERLPNNALIHNSLGKALAGLGRFEEALAQYRQALTIDPGCALARCNLADLLTGRGQFDEALEQYRQGLQIEPKNATLHCNMGAVLTALDRRDEALAHYRTALELQPNNAKTYYGLGVLLADRGQFDQALACFEKALKIQPDYALAHCKLAWLRATCPVASLRNGGEAIEHAVQANRLCQGKQPEVLDALAAAYAEAGWFSEAVATAGKALALATQHNNGALADAVRARLARYEAGKPYYQVPSSPAVSPSKL
jgi:tetratricopeptide (TPR) repeat protein